MFRAHRGKTSRTQFLAHRGVPVTPVVVHGSTALRQAKRRKVKAVKAPAVKAAAYKSLLPATASGGVPRGKAAAYKPVKAPPSAMDLAVEDAQAKVAKRRGQ